MKIAVWHNLPSGGGKRALYYHVRGLVERGHTVECWSLSTADHAYLSLGEFAPEHVIPATRAIVRTPRFGRTMLSEYYEAVARMQAFETDCQRAAGEIEAGDFDLLFANSSVPFYMPYIMRHVRIPKILYLQEPCRPLYEADPILPWVEGVHDSLKGAYLRHPRLFVYEYLRLHALRLQAKQEWLNAQACDEILVNSYYSRESVLRVYGREVKVCYLGIDTGQFRSLNRVRERFIAGLGSCDSIKGLDLAIRAIALLPAPQPPLVWVANSGSDSYRKAMIELAEALGVKLDLRSRVSDEELAEVLNRASALVYTSHLEPFGFAPLEANACATPVVAVAEGGVRETMKDGVNGILVDREPEEIACALQSLLDDESLARRMGENAAAYVRQEWSIERSVDRLEEHLLRTVRARQES
jgi:glycosyltransferase involved in cell wall biosynthesis